MTKNNYADARLKKFIIYSGITVFLAFLFVGFTLVVRTKILNPVDFAITVKLQNHLPRDYDEFLSVFSLIGSFEIISAILLLLVLLRRKIRSLLIFIPFLATHLVEIFGKGLVRHPGPPFMFFRYNLNFLFPSSYVQPGSSYPSGHSLRTLFLTVLLVYIILKSRVGRRAKIFLFGVLTVFDLIMLISRISLGEHWTTDVVGGAILGTGGGIFSLLFL